MSLIIPFLLQQIAFKKLKILKRGDKKLKITNGKASITDNILSKMLGMIANRITKKILIIVKNIRQIISNTVRKILIIVL